MSCGDGATSNRSQADLEPVPSTPASLDVEVGTGENEFVPLSDGAQVELTYGKQGSYHIWTSVRLRDATVEQAQINVSMRFEDSGAAAGPPSRWPAEPLLVAGARIQPGMRNFIEQAPLVVGKRIILRAEVIARDGRHGAGERVVVPHGK
jgi:hypothetical protein